jgi:hypothetical protein
VARRGWSVAPARGTACGAGTGGSGPMLLLVPVVFVVPEVPDRAVVLTVRAERAGWVKTHLTQPALLIGAAVALALVLMAHRTQGGSRPTLPVPCFHWSADKPDLQLPFGGYRAPDREMRTRAVRWVLAHHRFGCR